MIDVGFDAAQGQRRSHVDDVRSALRVDVGEDSAVDRAREV